MITEKAVKKTIEERAREFTDNHEQAELELRGLGHVYEYSRIYNSEKVAYERGATEQKAIDDERIAELEKKIALLVLEVYNKNKQIAELKAMEE